MVYQLSSLEIKDQARITAGYKTRKDRSAADLRTAAFGERLHPSAEPQQLPMESDCIPLQSHTQPNDS